MCGIAGFILPEDRAAAAARLKRMTDAIQHRGPDGEGHVIRSSGESGCVVGLGHRRLAILDLSDAGRQPMVGPDQKNWIVFNGEIYNFWDVRQKLELDGERFHSRCDTEVLLRALMRDGEGAVEQMNGIFALAWWDETRRRLVLSRDRLGVKPLYYYHQDGVFLFGSEIKALLAAGVEAELRLEGVSDYLRFGYCPEPQTLFRGIFQLEPGTTLIYENGTVTCRPFWDLRPFLEERRERTAEELLAQLDRSVEMQMLSDVPVGAFLSGGVDSSAIVASMAATTQDVRTFCIGFRARGYDESQYARQMADHVSARHQEHMFEAADVSLVETAIRHMDEPFADDALLPTYMMCRLARETLTVVLSGDGGDEVFAGYDKYRTESLLARLNGHVHWMAPAAELGAKAALKFATSPCVRDRAQWLQTMVRTSRMSATERYVAKLAVCSHDFINEACRRPNGLGDTRLEALLAEPNAEDFGARMLYADLRFELPNQMLKKVDRMSMASSLEVRVPLLDHEFVQFAAALPSRQRIRGTRGKYLLREALRDRVPAALLNRRKHGFDVPLTQWFRTSLATFIRATLTGTAFARHGVLDADVIARMVRDHEAGVAEHSRAIFSLLTFQLWHDRYVTERAFTAGGSDPLPRAVRTANASVSGVYPESRDALC